ncbi:sigma-70 family RNA polymerase sigma factor [Candidatus Poribacteria bacterium]|nr:sigma-70 family RNA polymerase sigma factor [Candidatus Poribacteria bacterium]
MADTNVQLINRVLEGEEEAFATLVRTYQKRIHALAWRKIGDYHIAEEITQDTFLQVYRKISQLKNPHQFDGWLYVIVNRLCLNWFRRNKIKMESIEDIPREELDHTTFTQHDTDQRDEDTRAGYREIVKNLLEKLPESERTVMTLYYLGEMTVNEIGKFLGVSANTIKSRLSRARNKLKIEDHILISENRAAVQLSKDLTETVLKQIAELKPTPQVVKPTLPWVAFGTATVLIMLLLGTLSQNTNIFQKPYNLEALSEPTVQIVEAPITIDFITIPDTRTVIGRSITKTDNTGTGTLISDTAFAADGQDITNRRTFTQWTQTSGPGGAQTYDLFQSANNRVYAATASGIYLLAPDQKTWMNTHAPFRVNNHATHMVEHRGTLYYVNTDQIYISTDEGQTWNTLCTRPKGTAVQLLFQDVPQQQPQMLLCLKEKGIYKSDDHGKNWKHQTDLFNDEIITTATSIKDTMFIGTHKGLYISENGTFRKMPVEAIGYGASIHSLTVNKNNLYVVSGPDLFSPGIEKQKAPTTARNIHYTADAGTTWFNITPTYGTRQAAIGFDLETKLLVTDKTLLLLGIPPFRSTDNGQTWNAMLFNINAITGFETPVLATKDGFYKAGLTGIFRTNDKGDMWFPFYKGIIGTRIEDLTLFDNSLYVYTGSQYFKSDDNGNTWQIVPTDFNQIKLTKTAKGNREIAISHSDNKLIRANNTLYRLTPYLDQLLIGTMHLEQNEIAHQKTINPLQHWEQIEHEMLLAHRKEALEPANPSHDTFDTIAGGFAVSDDTIFVEYRRRLLKMKLNTDGFTDTGLLDDTPKPSLHEVDRGFKVDAAAGTVYVGKRNGRLFQSVDNGDSWRDITPNIPAIFTDINDIKFLGKKVYVATDTGVLTSGTGNHWRILTDTNGTQPIIDKLTVSNRTLFGAGDNGIYRVDQFNKWEQLSQPIPGKVISLSVNGNKAYIGTKVNGIYNTNLETIPHPIHTER